MRIVRVPRAACALVMSYVMCAGTVTAQAGEEQVIRVVFPNGLTLLLLPVPGARHIAVESFYRFGFMHEPKGMTQSAHLLEHLVCYSATKSYKSHESFDLLSAKGLVNAETLPDFTHYDYMVPASELDLVLKVELERLTSLKITGTEISQEAPRCYGEADSVERVPQAGMLKHAFMAFSQAWQHGAKTALIRGGLTDMSVESLQQLQRDTYRPHAMVLAVAGGFDMKKVEARVRDSLGSIPNTHSPRADVVNWSSVPTRAEVRWDSSVRGLCLAYAPPDAPAERLALSIWGSMLGERLAADAELKSMADMVIASNPTWNVGVLPFFVYAAAKPDADLARLRRRLESEIAAFAKRSPSMIELMQIRGLARQMATPHVPDLKTLEAQAGMISAQTGGTADRAIMLSLGQLALTTGLRETVYEADLPAAAKAVESMSGKAFSTLMKSTTASDRLRVITVVPQKAGTRP